MDGDERNGGGEHCSSEGRRRPTSPTRYTSEWEVVGDGGQDGCIQRKVGVLMGKNREKQKKKGDKKK
jgi:hypothetical protein